MENESLTEALTPKLLPITCSVREEEKNIALHPAAEAFHLHSLRAEHAILRRFHLADNHVFFADIESIMTMQDSNHKSWLVLTFLIWYSKNYQFSKDGIIHRV